MNKKPTILAVASLGSLALIGTGFAGWVISTSATASADGGITAYVVADERVRIESQGWDEPDPSNAAKTEIRFGKPATMEVEHPWLTADSDVGVERLEAVYTINLWSSVQAAPTISLNTYSVAEATSPASLYGTALDGEYITGPAITNSPAELPGANISGLDDNGVASAVADLNSKVYYTLNAGATTSDPVGQNFQIQVHFVFGWGAKVGGVNPYNYFNAQDPAERPNDGTKTWGDLALEALTAVKNANGASFNFTMTIAPSSGN